MYKVVIHVYMMKQTDLQNCLCRCYDINRNSNIVVSAHNSSNVFHEMSASIIQCTLSQFFLWLVFHTFSHCHY